MTEGFVNGRLRGLDEKQRANAIEVLDAAAKAFTQRGYAATSVDDVADLLGSSKGRIYHYFRTKGDLFIGIHHQALEWALEAISGPAQRTDIGAAEKLRLMVHAHVMHMMDRVDYVAPSQAHAEMNLASEGRKKDEAVDRIFEMRRQFEAYYVEVVGEGIKSGEFRSGDVNLMVKAVLGTVNWMNVWFRPDDAGTPPAVRERIAAELTEFALSGLGA